jgi:hypothetical protein
LLAPGCVPLLLSDGNPTYLPAIARHFGHWVQLPRRQAKGPAPKPRWMPLPGLLYAQVVKKMRRRRMVEVKRHVVIGTQAAVDEVLRAWGWVINTSFVERLNLSLRQRVAPIRRGAAPRRVRVKWGCAIPWSCSRSITILYCPTPVCVRR